MSETDRNNLIYDLVIDVAGPNYRDQIVLNDVDSDGITPNFVDHDGMRWERYVNGDDYVEIRRDFVIKRQLISSYPHESKIKDSTFTKDHSSISVPKGEM